jgi:hypothetical protein
MEETAATEARLEVLYWIVPGLLVEARPSTETHIHEEERGPIGTHSLDIARGENTAGTGSIFDHDRSV